MKKICQLVQALIICAAFFGRSFPVCALGAPEVAPPGINEWVRTGTMPALSIAGDGRTKLPDWKFWDITIDLQRSDVRVVNSKGGGFLDQMLGEGDFVFNGAYFLKDYSPAGWLVDRDQIYGKPNFKANGAVFYVRDGLAWITSIKTATKKLSKSLALAVQNGPMLVDYPGVARQRLDASHKASRTIICLRDVEPKTRAAQKFSVILIKAGLKQGPTLRQVADLLAKSKEQGGFGCQQALNLDGGSSTGVLFKQNSGIASSPPGVPIGHALVVSTIADIKKN